MNRYEVVIYWNSDEEAFVAEVSELSGCAAEGQTREAAIVNVEAVIQDWLESAREAGRQIPEPRGRVTIA
jgi:predicted RNase H-like HicB family nuclease